MDAASAPALAALLTAIVMAVIAPIVTHYLRRADRAEDRADRAEVAKQVAIAAARVAVVAEDVKSSRADIKETLAVIQNQTDGNLSRVQVELLAAQTMITDLKRLIVDMQSGKVVPAP